MRQTSIFHIDVQKKLTSSSRVSVKPNMLFCCCIEMMLCISFVEASKKVRQMPETSHTSQKTGNEVKCQSSKTLIFLFFSLCGYGARGERMYPRVKFRESLTSSWAKTCHRSQLFPLPRVTNQRRRMIYLSKNFFLVQGPTGQSKGATSW